MERRKHQRFRVDVWIRCITSEDWKNCLCAVADISLGGMLLRFPLRPLPEVGELLEVGFVGENLPRGLELDCEVVRHADDGLGVRFLNLTQATRESLRRLIDEISTGGPEAAPPQVAVSSTEYSGLTGGEPPPAPAEPPRARVTTVPMADKDQAPLIEQTRAHRRSTPRVPIEAIQESVGIDLSGSLVETQETASGEEAGRPSSDIQKALQSATGDHAAVPGEASIWAERPEAEKELERSLGDLARVPTLLVPPSKVPWERFEHRQQVESVIASITGERSYEAILSGLAARSDVTRAAALGILAQLVGLGLVGLRP